MDQRLHADPHRDRFDAQLARRACEPLRRRATRTLQVNLGKRCNQACRHCHVDAGPARTESMGERTAMRVLELLRASPGVTRVDLTGGAPELNPHFRTLVSQARAAGREVMVRCNLTVLLEPGQEDTHRFYAEQRVHVVASLPCYTPGNVDAQRGGGVFERSIRALQRLNAQGYGAAQGADDAHALRLDLVYNPLGASLPPAQAALEAEYRESLAAELGLRFDRLLTIANMPIHRFADDLARSGRLDGYLDLLERSFNPVALDGVMCRDLVSVDWNGRLADCDFNQMLDLPLGAGARTIFEIDSFDALEGAPITTASHCLGCTAGQGSSCGGALAS